MLDRPVAMSPVALLRAGSHSLVVAPAPASTTLARSTLFLKIDVHSALTQYTEHHHASIMCSPAAVHVQPRARWARDEAVALVRSHLPLWFR